MHIHSAFHLPAGSMDDNGPSSSGRGRAGSQGSGGAAAKAAAAARPSEDWRSPVYTIIAVNAAVYALSNVLHILPSSWLQLGLGKAFAWWQVATSAFTHGSLMHLAETTFFTYIFGRLVER